MSSNFVIALALLVVYSVCLGMFFYSLGFDRGAAAIQETVVNILAEMTDMTSGGKHNERD